jgi:hypothetical protein
LSIIPLVLFAMSVVTLFITYVIEDPEFREFLNPLYEWPLVAFTGEAGNGWEVHFLLVMLWICLVASVMAVVGVVLVIVKFIVKEAGPFKRQKRKEAGQDSEKEVSEVWGRIRGEDGNQP